MSSDKQYLAKMFRYKLMEDIPLVAQPFLPVDYNEKYAGKNLSLETIIANQSDLPAIEQNFFLDDSKGNIIDVSNENTKIIVSAIEYDFDYILENSNCMVKYADYKDSRTLELSLNPILSFSLKDKSIKFIYNKSSKEKELSLNDSYFSPFYDGTYEDRFIFVTKPKYKSGDYVQFMINSELRKAQIRRILMFDDPTNENPFSITRYIIDGEENYGNISESNIINRIKSEPTPSETPNENESLKERFRYKSLEEVPDYVIQLLPNNYDAIYAGRLVDLETVSANQQGLSNELEKRTFLTKKNGYITDPYTNVKIPSEAIRYNFEKIFGEEVCLVPYNIISTDVDASSYVKTINYPDFDKETINIQNYYLPEPPSNLSFNAKILSPFYEIDSDIVVFANKPKYKIGDKVEYKDILRGKNKIDTILGLSFDNFPQNEYDLPTPVYKLSKITQPISEKHIIKLIEESDSSEDKPIDPLDWNWVRLKSIQEMKDEFGRDWQTITEYGNRDLTKIQAFINVEYFNPILQKVYYTGQPEMLRTVHVNKKMLTDTLYVTEHPSVFENNSVIWDDEEYKYLSLSRRILTSSDIDLFLNKSAIYTQYTPSIPNITEKSLIQTQSVDGLKREITFTSWSSNINSENYVDISKYLDYPEVNKFNHPRFKAQFEIQKEIQDKYGFSLSKEEFAKIVKDEYGISISRHLNAKLLKNVLSPRLMNELYDNGVIIINDSKKITQNLITNETLFKFGDAVFFYPTMRIDFYDEHPNVLPPKVSSFIIDGVGGNGLLQIKVYFDDNAGVPVKEEIEPIDVINIIQKGYGFIAWSSPSQNNEFTNQSITKFYNSIQIKLAKLSVEQQMAVKGVLSALDKQISSGQSVSPSQLELINEKVTKIRSILS